MLRNGQLEEVYRGWYLPGTMGTNYVAAANDQGEHPFPRIEWLPGNANNIALSNFITIDVPLGLLWNEYWTTNTANYSRVRSTRYLDANFTSNSFRLSDVMLFKFKLPMPFTNGIAVQIWDNEANSAWTVRGGFTAWWFETNSTAPSYPYSNYRLRAARWAGEVKNVTDSPTNVLGLLRGPGIIAGIQTSICAVTNGMHWKTEGTAQNIFGDIGENPWHFKDVATGLEWFGSGHDDTFINTYGYSTAQQWAGYDIGTPYRATDGIDINTAENCTYYIGESYRWFWNDAFTWGADGCRWEWPIVIDTDAAQGVVWYYAP
jgi:hypothetical protein